MLPVFDTGSCPDEPYAIEHPLNGPLKVQELSGTGSGFGDQVG
jgi:hypothetical protein